MKLKLNSYLLVFSLIIIILFSIFIITSKSNLLENVNQLLNYENQSNSNLNVSDEIIIETINGKIKGFHKDESGYQVIQFLGIPYAKPPIKEKRFKKPIKITNKWKGIHVADRWPDFCKQIDLKQYEYLTPIMNYNNSEDCLYLNIWTPIDLFNMSGSLKPVIVYIHGGVFVYMGSSFDIFNGAVISSLGDVVFVTFNFRLGVFGFLDTGADDYDNYDINSEVIPKNVGFYDQIMALNWVRDNIKQFGGNPNEVTLMGQSAGAIAIGLLMSTPLANNLFERAILESASPMQMKFFFQISQNNYKRVLQLTNCTQNKVKQQIQCLRKLNENNLNEIHSVLMNNSFLGFSPSIPSLMFSQFPREAFDYDLAENEVKQKQILLGSNADEGSLFLHQIRPQLFPLEQLPDIDRKGLIKLLQEFGSSAQNLSESQIKTLIDTTLGINGDNPEDIRRQLSLFMGDFLFKCPVIKFADSLTQWPNVTVYMYYFTQRSGHLPEWVGSSHWEEVQFVFGLPLRYPHKYPTEQQTFTKRLIKTWTQFARNGEMLTQLGKVWPKYSSENGQHMELNSERSSIGVKLNENYYSLYEIAFETIK